VFSEPNMRANKKLFVQTPRSTISCLFVFVVMLMVSVWVACGALLRTNTNLVLLWSCLYYASSNFTQTLILATSPFSNLFLFVPKWVPRFIFETKLLSKVSIHKIIWTHKVEWSHYFTNLHFVDIYKRISNTFKKTF
jgi:hypothetical protein